MSIRTLNQKIGTLRSCLSCAFKKRIDSRPPMEVGLSSMFSRKIRTIRTIRNFSHLEQIRRRWLKRSSTECPKKFDKWVTIKWWLCWLPIWWWQRNAVCNENKNASSSINVNKKQENWCNLVEIMALSFRPYFEGENRVLSESINSSAIRIFRIRTMYRLH